MGWHLLEQLAGILVQEAIQGNPAREEAPGPRIRPNRAIFAAEPLPIL
jgi:hypothetical protein